MKRFFYIVIAALTLNACGNSDTSSQKPEDFITNLYNNYVFNYGELDSIAGNFDPAVLDSLRNAYANEFAGEEPGYAVWLFRTGQNGDGEQSLDSITADGNDLYTAHITDCGTPCTCQMHIVIENGKPVLKNFKTTYKSTPAFEDFEGEWTVTAINGNHIDAKATITFNTADKTFGATAGCNQIGGKIVNDDTTVRFEQIATTEMACDKEIMELEKSLTEALAKVTTFFGFPDEITLSDNNSTSLIIISRNAEQ